MRKITQTLSLFSFSAVFCFSTWASTAQTWVPAYQKKSLQESVKGAETNSANKDTDTNTDIVKEEETKSNAVKDAAALAPAVSSAQVLSLKAAYKIDYKNKKDLLELKKQTLKLAGHAVPILIEVMKEKSYPDKNRWVATFLLGKIMGQKASPFIAKFVNHPHWILRLASLKTLLSLNEKKYGNQYVDRLKDESYIVRVQALENIRQLQLNEHGLHVWAMLFDENNYAGKKGFYKRTDIIKNCIRTIGELKYDKAKSPFLTMIQKKKYEDMFEDLDYTLGQITGKNSPDGNRNVKKLYWSRLNLKEKDL